MISDPSVEIEGAKSSNSEFNSGTKSIQALIGFAKAVFPDAHSFLRWETNFEKSSAFLYSVSKRI